MKMTSERVIRSIHFMQEKLLELRNSSEASKRPLLPDM